MPEKPSYEALEQRIVFLENELAKRKRIEKELFFKENIIKSSACAIATCTLEGEMTYGNLFFQKLWGFNTPGEFLGKPFQKFWKVEDRHEAIMQSLWSEGNWSGELKAEKKDGSLFDVQVSAAVVFDETGTPIAMTSTSIDITERKAIEAQTRLFQKIEGLGRMAGAVAHNFNNQLQVVIGNLEIAMEDFPQVLSPDENLSLAMQAARKAAEVSRLMLVYLGQTSGKYEPMDLSEICRQNLPLLQSAIPEGILLETDFPFSCPVTRANAGQIQQILTNLVTNAREAIPDEGGTIHLTVKTVFHTHIPSANRIPFDWHPRNIFYACLEVSDTGCGISKKDIEKIFDPFFTTKFTGRGMGLPVVGGIVKAHGGGVTVDSEPGQGSVFRIYLPV
jgi:PAS domain S-box-containing protein